jgi:hypothetical protein
MKRSHVLLASIIATLLLAAPAPSHAFCCGFFGGGFGFSFGGGWSGWGGPGWWGPGYWGGYPGYWGGPAYWHRPYYHHVRYHDRFWSDPVYGLGWPRVAPPLAQVPESDTQK